MGTASSVRPAAVAGSFYPAGGRELAAMVDRFVAEAGDPPAAVPPAALVAPHAGYVYSGPIAGSAFAQIAAAASRIERVVVVGPSHFVPIRGLALPVADAMATPLGTVPICPESRRAVAALPQVTEDDHPHRREHALEVELPFLQRVLGDFRVVPLVVGSASPGEVAEVMESLWGEGETLIVVSSDLSHYLPYEEARVRDEATAKRIVELDGPLGTDRACGARAIDGLLAIAARRRLKGRLLDLRSSGDTAGDHRAVVGYGAFAFAPHERPGDGDA